MKLQATLLCALVDGNRCECVLAVLQDIVGTVYPCSSVWVLHNTHSFRLYDRKVELQQQNDNSQVCD